MRQYKLISADSHINEPPGLWQDRVPAKFKARAPRMERTEKGHAWILEGALDPINFGGNASATKPYEERSPWMFWEDVAKGGYIASERLKDMDKDGVDAELLYPTPRPSSAVWWNNKDRDFHLACVRAYNDWLSEFSAYAPDRLGGIAMMPTSGIADTLAELKHTLALPGMRGPLLGQWPEGGLQLTAASDPFWAAMQEAGLPVNIHVAFVEAAPGEVSRGKLSGEFRILDAPLRMQTLINSGVLDRFPKLKFAFVEVDYGWVPYLMEQMDDRHKRLDPARRTNIKLKPSEYCKRNFYFVYITDRYGIKNRDIIGPSHILWSSDFPHTGADWPHSWDTINECFRDVPPVEKHAILAGNAAALYKLA